jgi:6-pyruvoyl-tetrahydropterin synthase
MYTIKISKSFSAAHFLTGYKSDEAVLHAHEFKVSANFGAEALNDIGLIALPRDLDRLLGKIIMTLPFIINDTTPFNEVNPTPSYLAQFFFEGIQESIKGEPFRVLEVTVSDGIVISGYSE